MSEYASLGPSLISQIVAPAQHSPDLQQIITEIRISTELKIWVHCLVAIHLKSFIRILIMETKYFE